MKNRILNIYKKAISLPLYYLLGPGCRFIPTCSEYFIQAIDEHGALKGTKMGALRVLSCHPFSKKARYDPVSK